MASEKKNPLARICRPLSSIEPSQISWLWKGRIPVGCITLLEGDGGIGKSFVASAIGSSLSVGRALPDDEAREPVNVLLLAAEDDPSVVLRPRFEAQGADLDRVFIWDQDLLLNSESFQELRKLVKNISPGLIVIDPIVSFLGTKLDSNKATDVRSVMKPLHELAAESKCSIVVVRHWNKATQSSAAHRGAGSVDFRNAARSVLQVIKTPKDRFVTVEKSNYGEEGRTLTFSLDRGQFVWTGVSNMKADEILASMRPQGAQESQIQSAQRLILDTLVSGPTPSSVLFEAALEHGISKATLKRAKDLMPVRSVKSGLNWAWELEEIDIQRMYEGTQEYQESQT